MISVSCEEVYNNMDRAMINFKMKLFKKEHKSHLTELDIMALNE